MEGDKKVILKEKIYEILALIIDPEIGINIVDLGLVYDVNIDNHGKVVVKMTLTAPNCPYGEFILNDVHQYISGIEGISTVNVDLTFEPPWDPSKISDEAKYYMGIL